MKWRPKYLEVELRLGQILEKLRMRRAKMISYINLKLPLKRQMNWSTGYNCVKNHNFIRIQAKNYSLSWKQ